MLLWASHGELWVDDGFQGTFGGYDGPVRGYRVIETPSSRREWEGKRQYVRKFLSRFSIDAANTDSVYGSNLIGTYSKGHPLCYLDSTKASYFVLFTPINAEELALLANTTVADLPDVLQHWSLLKPYIGNPILDRVDPMLWKAKNPWIALDLRIRIAFSKRGMSRIDKSKATADIPPVNIYVERQA